MAANTIKVSRKCSGNPDCMRITVGSDEDVDALAVLFPALSETGGYDGQLRDPEVREDILDYRSFGSSDEGGRFVSGWGEFSHSVRLLREYNTGAWSEKNKAQLVCCDFLIFRSYEDGRMAHHLRTRIYTDTRSWSRTREIKTRGFNPTIDARAETAKAIARVLNESK